MVCLAIFLLCIYFNFVSVFKRYCIWVAFCMCIAKLIMAVEYSVQKVVLNDRDALLLQIVLVDVHGVLTFLWGGIRSVFFCFCIQHGFIIPILVATLQFKCLHDLGLYSFIRRCLQRFLVLSGSRTEGDLLVV